MLGIKPYVASIDFWQYKVEVERKSIEDYPLYFDVKCHFLRQTLL